MHTNIHTVLPFYLHIKVVKNDETADKLNGKEKVSVCNQME